MAKVLQPGVQTLIEEWKGRVGYLDLGIANSGCMDHFASRAANLIVGNDLNEALIEITAGRFSMEFGEETVLAITGADFGPTLNDEPVPLWQAIRVKKGDIVNSGNLTNATLGFRQYWAFAGGIDVPLYLGSKSTSIYGGFGGYQGRPLQRDDIIKIGEPKINLKKLVGLTLRKDLIPKYVQTWDMRAIPGPNAYPDYFSDEGMKVFYSSEFTTQIYSDRSAIRLSGPELIWAEKRKSRDGHPSNTIDHGYPIPGCLNISGDTPILLAHEGPTAGGYICALSVIYADQWIMGQIVPGRDTIRFSYSSIDDAIEQRKKQNSIFAQDSVMLNP